MVHTVSGMTKHGDFSDYSMCLAAGTWLCSGQVTDMSHGQGLLGPKTKFSWSALC